MYFEYRYSLRDAHEGGQKDHPLTWITEYCRRLDLRLVDATPYSIGDCWIFKTINEIKDPPAWVNRI